MFDLRMKYALGNTMYERSTAMPKTAPWHSTKQPKHHNNTECNTGNNIEKENLRSGTGGKPLCEECAKLNAQSR